MERKRALLRLRNAAQIVCVAFNKEKFKTKDEMREVCIIPKATLIVGENGVIEAVGESSVIDPLFAEYEFDRDIDCSGKCVIPGFVDAHTHAVYSGDRIHEFIMKIEGKTYMEIHKEGGGIGFTVGHTRKSPEEELITLLVERVNRMAKHGTTLVEVKSGYGLDMENEIKMLRVIKRAQDSLKVEMVANYCGAHSVPKGSTEQEATKDIIENQLPEIAKLKQKGEINPEFIDIFCEKGVFERESTKQILEAGLKYGLPGNFHGDELSFIDSGTLGAELNSVAISHIEHMDDNGIKAMAEKNIVGVILPTTHFLLKLKDPPVRKMITEGVPVALGTDFNPNAHCLSMPYAMSLGCINLKMMPGEVLVAATLNSAASLNRSDRYGSLEVGKFGDCVIIDAPRWEHVIYQMVDPPIEHVIKKGEVIYSKSC